MAKALYKRNLYPAFPKVDVPHGKMFSASKMNAYLHYTYRKHLQAGYKSGVPIAATILCLQCHSCTTSLSQPIKYKYPHIASHSKHLPKNSSACCSLLGNWLNLLQHTADPTYYSGWGFLVRDFTHWIPLMCCYSDLTHTEKGCLTKSYSDRKNPAHHHTRYPGMLFETSGSKSFSIQIKGIPGHPSVHRLGGKNKFLSIHQ